MVDVAIKRVRNSETTESVYPSWISVAGAPA